MFLRLIRIEYFVYTTLLPLLGAATIAGGVSVDRSLVLMLVAFFVHLHVCFVNDVADLPIDRENPRRKNYPLVRGVVKPWQFIAVSILLVPVTMLVTFFAGGGWPAQVALLGAFLFVDAYSVAGKRFAWPILTDLSMSVGYCALIPYGAALIASPLKMTWLVFIWGVMWTMRCNVMGGIRDLAEDSSCGAFTTPTYFGARLEGSGQSWPQSLRTYLWSLEAVSICLALGITYISGVGIWALAANGVLALLSLFLLRTFMDLAPLSFRNMVIAGLLQLGVTMLMGIVPFIPARGGTVLLAFGLLFVVPHLRHDPRPIVRFWISRRTHAERP